MLVIEIDKYDERLLLDRNDPTLFLNNFDCVSHFFLYHANLVGDQGGVYKEDIITNFK